MLVVVHDRELVAVFGRRGQVGAGGVRVAVVLQGALQVWSDVAGERRRPAGAAVTERDVTGLGQLLSNVRRVHRRTMRFSEAADPRIVAVRRPAVTRRDVNENVNVNVTYLCK